MIDYYNTKVDVGDYVLVNQDEADAYPGVYRPEKYHYLAKIIKISREWPDYDTAAVRVISSFPSRWKKEFVVFDPEIMKFTGDPVAYVLEN